MAKLNLEKKIISKSIKNLKEVYPCFSEEDIIHIPEFCPYKQLYCCSTYYWKEKSVLRLLLKHLKNFG